jgi:2,3-bisphosphoglycerate-independent phosphoglycerate mutase
LRSIEDIDKKVVGTLRAGLDKRKEEYRLLIVPDHKTPVAMRDHDQGPVPFLLYDSSKPNRASHFPFDERAVDEATTQVDDGTELMKMLLRP